MESFYAAAPPSMDDLLDFSSDIGEEEDDTGKSIKETEKPSSLLSSLENVLDSDSLTPSFPDFIEEDLEWISNKDAFPSLESFVGLLPEKEEETKTVSNKHNSPVSVLENSSSSSNCSNCYITMRNFSGFQVPVRSRSKRTRRPRKNGFLEGEKLFYSKGNSEKKNGGVKKTSASGANVIGRKCLHCGSEKTPQWRAGPMGPKTLCNACGVRYKSGRLVPEYRPANSPTFSTRLHSNSHRKVMEIRRQKQLQQMGMVDNG